MNETRPGHNFVGDLWKHGHKICKHFTSIFTPVWKHKNSNYILYKIRTGRCIIGQGAKQYGEGAAPSVICLAGTLVCTMMVARLYAALCSTYRDDGAAGRGTYHDGGATRVLDAQPERRVAPVHLVEEADLDDVLVDGAVLVPQPHALRQLHRLQQPLVLNTHSRPVRHGWGRHATRLGLNSV